MEEWHRKYFQDLFIDGCFASFDEFNLPPAHFFRCLQARHYVQCQIPCFPQMPAHNSIDRSLSLQPLAKGSISTIYNLISGLKSTPLNKIKMAWEQDLGLPLSDDVWDAILKQVHSSSMCARHSLLQFKIVHRAHISKMKLFKLYPDLHPNCNKCKSPSASLIPKFWLCPSLEKFWKNVFQTLSETLDCPIEPYPLIVHS